MKVWLGLCQIEVEPVVVFANPEPAAGVAVVKLFVAQQQLGLKKLLELEREIGHQPDLHCNRTA